MEFDFSEEHRMLKDSAKKLFARSLTKEKIREIEGSPTGHSEALWKEIAEAGWLGLIFPDEYGGSGLSLFELAVLYEECGRALMPTVFYSTLTGGLAILNGATEKLKTRILPEVIDGRKLITLAVVESQAIHDLNYIKTCASYSHGKYYLSGSKLFVQNAVTANYLIVAAKTDGGAAESGITLLIVDRNSRGIRFEPLNTFGRDPQSEVIFDNVEIDPENAIGAIGTGKGILDKTLEQATALQCVEMVGGAQEVLRKTTEYVKQRIQFGRPIGSFQAVQHHLANIATAVEGAYYVAYRAAWLLSQGRQCSTEVSLAKAWVSDTYKNATVIGHQLHGGIGYALEYDLYAYSNRAKAAEIWFGTRDYHIQKIADQLGL
jgi:3-oxocholest-4-en-26-oyl-CoA dehydrogenase beta subunit